jgi:hypothetical protein
MVTTVPPDQPLAYTRRPIFVSASVQLHAFLTSALDGSGQHHTPATSHLQKEGMRLSGPQRYTGCNGGMKPWSSNLY